MRCRTAFLVEKRDGSTELLAAPKLARSLQQALSAAPRPEPGRAYELACVVLDTVQAQRVGGRPLRTAEIAATARAVLRAAGLEHAARAHEHAAAEKRARQALWHDLVVATEPELAGAVVATRQRSGLPGDGTSRARRR